MNNKTNYTLVGAFVLLGILAIFFFILWMIQPSKEEQMKRYAIYFNESVLGLNIDAPVKYRGIEVGKVTKLEINPKNTEQILVLIDVKKTTPIKTTTVAKLTAQGITGLTYINLTLGEKSSPLLEKPPVGEKYPVIQTAPSFFKNVQTSLDTIYTKVSKSLDGVEEVLNESNQQEFHKLLQESAAFMQNMNKTFDQKTQKHLQNAIANVDVLTKKLQTSLGAFDALVGHTKQWEDSISHSLHGIMMSYQSVERAMDQFDLALQRGDFNLKDISQEIIPAFNKSLKSLDKVLVELQGTLNELQKNPSDILFKETEIKPAPGE
jgi:phospholipid/cholesterol/gamma-HCH transport system substrate-binding protein